MKLWLAAGSLALALVAAGTVSSRADADFLQCFGLLLTDPAAHIATCGISAGAAADRGNLDSLAEPVGGSATVAAPIVPTSTVIPS